MLCVEEQVDDQQLGIIINSRLKDLNADISRILRRNISLREQLQKYQTFESWAGIGVCPLCNHNNQSAANSIKTDQSAASCIKTDQSAASCIKTDQSATSSIKTDQSTNSKPNGQSANGTTIKSENVKVKSEPKEITKKSKLRLNETQSGKRKRHYYTNSDSSPEDYKPHVKKHSSIFDSETQVPRPVGRVLVPETCPNDSVDSNNDYNGAEEEVRASEPERLVPGKVRRVDLTTLDSEIVGRHGLASQVYTQLNPDSEPALSSTPVSQNSKQARSRSRSRSSFWDSDDESGASQEITQIRKSPVAQNIETPVTDRSSCLFDKSDDFPVGTRSVKPEEESFNEDDDWLVAIKEETKKRERKEEKRILAEVTNTSNVSISSTPSPCLLGGKAYKQQSLVGMFKKPKVEVSDLQSFEGGSLNKKTPKRSPLKIRTDVENRSPVYSGDLKSNSSFEANTSFDFLNTREVRANTREERANTREERANTREERANTRELRANAREVMSSRSRPPLVRQNAVDYDEDDMHQNSVKFHAGPKHAALPSDTPMDDLDAASPDELGFSEVMNDLELDSQEVKVEHVFRRPVAPPREVDETLETSFDRVPKKDPEVGYVYHHTDRRKAVRQHHEGFDCKCCSGFHDHLPEEERAARISAVSRHRAEHVPPSTPPGFWEVGFPETQKVKQHTPVIEEERETRRLKRKYQMRDANKERENRKLAAMEGPGDSEDD